MVGDFNFIENPDDSINSELSTLSNTAKVSWQRLLGTHSLTEVQQPLKTFFRSFKEPGRATTATRIDRVYTSHSDSDQTVFTPVCYIPHLQHTSFSYNAWKLKMNSKASYKATSDHFAVTLKFCSTPPFHAHTMSSTHSLVAAELQASIGDKSEDENDWETLRPGAVEADDLESIEFVLAKCGREEFGWHVRSVNGNALWKTSLYNKSDQIAPYWLGVQSKRRGISSTQTRTNLHAHTQMHLCAQATAGRGTPGRWSMTQGTSTSTLCAAQTAHSTSTTRHTRTSSIASTIYYYFLVFSIFLLVSIRRARRAILSVY
jgi:hypothetical protein